MGWQDYIDNYSELNKIVAIEVGYTIYTWVNANGETLYCLRDPQGNLVEGVFWAHPTPEDAYLMDSPLYATSLSAVADLPMGEYVLTIVVNGTKIATYTHPVTEVSFSYENDTEPLARLGAWLKMRGVA